MFRMMKTHFEASPRHILKLCGAFIDHMWLYVASLGLKVDDVV